MGFWVAFALFALSTTFSYLTRPKQEKLRPKTLGDFQFPTAIEDRKQPVVWGTVKLAGPNVVWYGDFRAEKIRKNIQFGPDQVIGFRYHVGLQLAFSRGDRKSTRLNSSHER